MCAFERSEKGMDFNMERIAEYEIRVLPSNPKSYITLDSNPLRRCEANLVYQIPENTFKGIECKLRIRKKAKEFVDAGYRTRNTKTFVVLLKQSNTYQLLYVGKVYLLTDGRKLLYLSRCVGSVVSKHHFQRVTKKIFEHFNIVFNLLDFEILSVTTA